MPIFHELRTVFIHIPKCAGTSITSALLAGRPHGANGLPGGVSEDVADVPAQANVEWAASGIWDAIIAHPDGRNLLKRFRQLYPLAAISRFDQKHLAARILREFTTQEVWNGYFKFAFARNPWDRVVSTYVFIRMWLDKDPTFGSHQDRAYLLNLCTDFTGFVRVLPLLGAGEAADHVLDDKGDMIVDFVGRFENLETDFAHVCDTIGIESVLPCLNSSSETKPYRDYYTAETKSIVGELFARDIDLFGYKF